MDLDPNRIMEDCIADQLGMEPYWRIMQSVHTVDVSVDTKFQTLYNWYYLIRRNKDWRDLYYHLFESLKTRKSTFKEILLTMYDKTKMIEASFSSKMLATLNPDQPIWDSRVLACLGFQLTGKSKAEELDNAIALYARIEDWYAHTLITDTAQDCFAVFDRTFPKYTNVSKVKKLDFFLWSSR